MHGMLSSRLLLARSAMRTLRPQVAPLCQAAGYAPRPPSSQHDGAKPHGAAQEEEGSDLRTQLLKAALEEVPMHGWSIAALSAGAEKCGLSPMAHGLLPRGPVELVEHFSRGCDEALAAEMEARRDELMDLEVRNRLLLAMQARMQMVTPHAANWAEALALRALPTNLPHTLGDAQSLATVLIDACGESAREPLFPGAVDLHVKQVSISAIYGAAELYMLTDKSEGFTDTSRFIEREVQTLDAVAGKLGGISLTPMSLLLGLMAARR